MTESDKPFACNVPGCGQTFTNNDRLVVHRQTHTLSLKIGRKGDDAITDQTPTPTRFLKNCDEEGLFEELGENTENPFDRDFKTATKQGHVASAEKKTVTVVNTPAPITANESTETISTTIGTTEAPATCIVAVVVSPPEVDHTIVVDANNSTIPNATEFLLQTANASAALENGDNVDQSPKVSVLKKNSEIKTIIPDFISQPGNQVPKAIPAPHVVQNSIPTPAIVISPTVNPKPLSFIKNAKQKLKETIRIHQSQGKDVRKEMGDIITQAMEEAVTSCKRQSDNNNIIDDDDLEDEKRPLKRSRRQQEDLSSEEKRERFLERNRAAATRCREKRKMWIQALEKKAEEMTEVNTELQNEISCLKHEVAQLKGLLLAHRDCPMIANQQKINPHIFEQMTPESLIIGIPNNIAETAATLAEMSTIKLEGIPNGS